MKTTQRSENFTIQVTGKWHPELDMAASPSYTDLQLWGVGVRNTDWVEPSTTKYCEARVQLRGRVLCMCPTQSVSGQAGLQYAIRTCMSLLPLGLVSGGGAGLHSTRSGPAQWARS